ncbi:MAG: bifunctional oligoribonuclease/PAP phosphatase NrnA [Candidatus Latescibacteria bacterium]|nr:bifunctional oligoribonuclease/PAP phosphatase NrnA [Candidatus Latescibacterota bacterium]
MVHYPENKYAWRQIAAEIKNSHRIFISTHVNPDGDAIGSVMALGNYLKLTGKQIRIIIESKTPDNYKFLDPDNMIECCAGSDLSSNGPASGDLVIFLDMGRYDRSGNIAGFLVDNNARKVIIDHHPPELVDADIIALNTKACSTGTLIYDLLCYMDNSLINKKIALCILTAIISDTGFFRYSNTTERTHQITAELYEKGAKIADVRKHLENGQLLCRQKLLGFVLSKVEVTNCERIAYSVATTEMFEASGALREHTEGIIDQIRIIKGIKVAFLVIQENNDVFKVSVRTKEPISANEIATMLGGGGHRKAAGAHMKGSLENIISDIVQTAIKVCNAQDG